MVDPHPTTLAGVRYQHTNLIAHDWRRLARFYQDLFGCVPVPPERDQHGPLLERATGLPGAHLRGVHLRLPGHGDHGPTLEIYSYEETLAQTEPVPNRAGYGHLAFAVEDVEAAVGAVVSAGGSRLGDIVAYDVPPAGRVCFAYVRDPEGNIVELQRWSAPTP